MSGASVAIVVPAQDSVATFWAFDYARLMAHTVLVKPDIRLYPLIATGSLIPKQRETLFNTVLEQTDATHILSLDSDMRFPKDTLLRLLGHGVEAVVASYTERNPPFKPVAFADNKDYSQRAWPVEGSTGLRKIAACGFGCVLLETATVRRIDSPRFMIGYNSFAKTYLGEDVYFWLQLEKLGIPLFLDQDLTQEVRHIGRFEYGPEHSLRASLGRGETPWIETAPIEVPA